VPRAVPRRSASTKIPEEPSFPMQADRAGRDRPTVRVVRRVPNTLDIPGDCPLFRGVPSVISFDNNNTLGPAARRNN
jgi:hypothetical protein